ncbi:MAG: hypothetical protein J7507_07070, partial [Pseudoxanthomonas sp.]|nr:hypothetical protein [Pseudoxanthomonas sp.]
MNIRTAHRSIPPALRVAAVAFVLSLATGCAVMPEPTASEVQGQALGKVVVPPNWSAEASAAQGQVQV